MADGFEVESVLRRAPELGGEYLRGVSRRRVWGTEEKLRILAQSVAPGSSPAQTCRALGIASGQFYTWRKLFRGGELTGFARYRLHRRPLPCPHRCQLSHLLYPLRRQSPASSRWSCRAGVKLRVTGDVDAGSLRRILSALP